MQWALELMHTRRNVSPKRLVEPAPGPAQLRDILGSACAAPDHGRLRPWRLVLVPQDKRAQLAQAFEQALLERDPQASQEQREMARDKAFRAPVLVLAVAVLGVPDQPVQAPAAAVSVDSAGTPVADAERLVALGCAIQNILLAAHAAGFGSGLTSGQAMHSTALRGLFALQAHEVAVCCINLGTVSQHKAQGERAPLEAVLSSL
ncbi:MAG: nitroreductase family protein [Rhodoferax sp.]